MGNCNFKSEEEKNTNSKTNYQFHYVIGKGGFSKVWKIEKKKTKEFFAVKVMSKAQIITKRSVTFVMNERNLLSQIKHSFLVNMVCAFQDRENLYLVIDLLTGGDLRYHLTRRTCFTETESKFFICSLLVFLEYLHSNGIMHRDIKPENLLLDFRGYLRVTDLGIAKLWTPENGNDTSGTPGYMAPEVMCRQNHGVAADYYSVGVLCYEFMYGRRPYLGSSKKEIRDQILAKQVQIKKSEIPEGWSLEAADFINRLIQRKPINRLGLNGPGEVKGHPWIKDFPWKKLLEKELDAPFIPSHNEDNFDLKNLPNCDVVHYENVEDQVENNKQNSLNIKKRTEIQSKPLNSAKATPKLFKELFEGYDYEMSGKFSSANTGSGSNTSPLITVLSTKCQNT